MTTSEELDSLTSPVAPVGAHVQNGPTRAKRAKRPVVLWGVLSAAAVGVGVWRFRPLPVAVEEVVRGTAINAVYATGTVEPRDRVVVKAKATGAVDLRVREGARVAKGDLLAVIQLPSLHHDLEKAETERRAASQQAGANGPQLKELEARGRSIEADLNTAKSDRTRAARLVESGAIGAAELDRLVDRVAALESQLAASRAELNARRIELDAQASASSASADSLAAKVADMEVRAPMGGVVLSRFIDPGEVVPQNAPLLKIGGIDDLILEASIDEADIARVSLGDHVAISLYAFPEIVVKGDVFEILPEADRTKKTFLTRVGFQHPPQGLRVGMTAEADVVVAERPQALLVPVEAIDSKGAVFVVTGNRAQVCTPKFGVRDTLHVEVLDGLQEGDRVIVSALDGLSRDVRVAPKLRPPVDTLSPWTTTRSELSR